MPGCKETGKKLDLSLQRFNQILKGFSFVGWMAVFVKLQLFVAVLDASSDRSRLVLKSKGGASNGPQLPTESGVCRLV